MKRKISSIIVFTIIFLTVLSPMIFAKYIIGGNKSLNVYIDKTPPIISLESDGVKEDYPSTDLDNLVKKSNDVNVSTSDNVEVKKSEVFYNPIEPDFEGKDSKEFDKNTSLTEDGYYHIVTEDTSGNVTEMTVLVDKTPPEVQVKYFKKGEENKNGQVKTYTVTAIKNNKATGMVINTNEIMPIAGITTVYNENQLRNALNNKYSVIQTVGSIILSTPLTIDYDVIIKPLSDSNAITYNGYNNFIIVESGAHLTLDSMVIDTNKLSQNRGVTAINIKKDGQVIFMQNSIVDGGAGNTGILVNDGATAIIHSCHIANSKTGILVNGNGNLIFEQTEINRKSEFWSNENAILFQNFTGTCNFDKTNIRVRNNTNGVIIETSTGTVHISNGEIYSNSNDGVFSKNGTLNISGGIIYNNGNGINFGNGNLNISGGTIRGNKIGIYLNENYLGRMTITDVNIEGNTQYAINHSQNEDGSCTILGGTISGKIYLGQEDNYVNTNDKYPSFEVEPSTYYFKRKLVRTNSNDIANREIEKVTLTPNGKWYKYINGDEYIILWKGTNVKAVYKDYFGNELASEIITGDVGDTYKTEEKEIEGYDLIEIPSNAEGTFGDEDNTVEYRYDLKNVAKVTFEDLLSGIQSAKYWYNTTSDNFTGVGMDFENNHIFEEYGFYKVEVVNNVGLKKELTFSLNKDSYVR